MTTWFLKSKKAEMVLKKHKLTLFHRTCCILPFEGYNLWPVFKFAKKGNLIFKNIVDDDSDLEIDVVEDAEVKIKHMAKKIQKLKRMCKQLKMSKHNNHTTSSYKR